jgi:hypothetical protein
MLLYGLILLAACTAASSAEALDMASMGGCTGGGRINDGRIDKDGSIRGSQEIASLRLKYVWPEYGFTYEVHDQGLISELSAALTEVDQATEPAPSPAPAPITTPGLTTTPAPPAYRSYQTLSWTAGFGKQHRHYHLRILDDGSLYDPNCGRWLQNEKLSLILDRINVAAQAEFFGEPLTWPEVAAFFPVGGIATVRDLESGLEFRVRRHRGDSHADVEPLSAGDTATMKKIYGGNWSWSRRAVVVDFGENRKVAGSMNGMPHGWGDLDQNDFEGHFCIHFKDSRVHTTWKRDPGHQLMVLKSSGMLARELLNATPDRLIYWILAAVHQREKCTLRYATYGLPLAVLLKMIQLIRHMAAITCRTVSKSEDQAVVEASLLIYYYLPDPQKAHQIKVQFTLNRNMRELQPGWRLSAFQLKDLLTAGNN